jgi:predicted alpha/beta hydrolase
MTNTTELKLRTQDGRLLHGTAYSPQNPNETVVLLNPANAVKESYYTDFAAYLAA